MNRGQWRLLVRYENFHEHEKKKDHIAPKLFFFFLASFRGSGRAKFAAKFVFCCAHVTKQSWPWNVRPGAPGCAAPLGKAGGQVGGWRSEGH